MDDLRTKGTTRERRARDVVRMTPPVKGHRLLAGRRWPARTVPFSLAARDFLSCLSLLTPGYEDSDVTKLARVVRVPSASARSTPRRIHRQGRVASLAVRN